MMKDYHDKMVTRGLDKSVSYYKNKIARTRSILDTPSPEQEEINGAKVSSKRPTLRFLYPINTK
jgi:hypothetical protein